MIVISVTSDLGTKDHYVAAIKARALQLIPGHQWVDISHQVPAFDIAKAAFVLKNVWRDFPKGTIHLNIVDTEWRLDTPYIVVSAEGHFFIGADNGFFSLLLDGAAADSVHTIKMVGDEDLSFPSRSVFLPTAARLARGESLDSIGLAKEGYRNRPALQPVIEPHVIRGTVIYIDSYGNVITNITREVFYRVIGDKHFNIVGRGRNDNDLTRISRAYSEVPEGEKVALFTTAGYLEIAINRGVEGSGGGASSLLGLRENDVVRIEFDP